MSFQDNKPGISTRTLMLSTGLVIFIVIFVVNEGKKYKKVHDNSVVFTTEGVQK